MSSGPRDCASLLEARSLVDAPPVMRYPSWMDAQYVLHASTWNVQRVTATLPGTGPVISRSGRRFMIGFRADAAIVGTIKVGPFRDPASSGWELTATANPIWFALWTHGPIVCDEWYVITTPPEACLVYECLLD